MRSLVFKRRSEVPCSIGRLKGIAFVAEYQVLPRNPIAPLLSAGIGHRIRQNSDPMTAACLNNLW